ncbi:MAG: lycopene beta-cyclase CrtY [Sphingomonadaceae bacterium]|nr:lycopene beta-cyclase CrtY [Sphingomonadaceae bacterium]
MERRNACDVAILGGGLAGGLIALALRRARPELRALVIEGGQSLGGNHIWSFFASDVSAEGMALLAPLIGHRWEGYDVRFPAHARTLGTGYHSIRSGDFDSVLRAALPADALVFGAQVREASPVSVTLDGGVEIAAGGVIDCRGGSDMALLDCGWQKFVGLEIELPDPHGLERPIVMDATVEQIDGYRFVYSLPLGERRIFVEDTYYSDGPALDVAAIEARVLAYAEARGWRGGAIIHRETGVLPVTLGGDFEGYWRSGGPTAKAGTRAGLFHPTTGYSLPDAVETALLIAGLDDLSGPALERALHDHARRKWEERGFYRMLDRMMFRGAGTGERHRILERFYTLDAGLIERFYAGRSSLADKARILAGKPPIPIGRAIGALWESRTR